ncbi:hypothetical protein [Helicobacter sp. 13S00477-4]|uniref:hypothetical protein n=1 Tax=Helicobacter sp. 13S00477-4 TaxID=1905759 RepID=UPI000BA5238B|nr:hypothetical protein [Helicobacter sp. 13S00477-4]PAF50480.1 hypothetical protein BKH44_08190 [Helicobacter sp. 13S00477-4]
MKNKIIGLDEWEKDLVESFKDYISSGKRPFVVLKKISRSKMRRVFKVLFVYDGQVTAFPSIIVKKINKEKIKGFSEDYIINGCGMDMYWVVIEEIYKALGIENEPSYNMGV